MFSGHVVHGSCVSLRACLFPPFPISWSPISCGVMLIVLPCAPASKVRAPPFLLPLLRWSPSSFCSPWACCCVALPSSFRLLPLPWWSRPDFFPWPAAFSFGLLCLLWERSPFLLACAASCARIFVGLSHALFLTAHPRSFPPRVASLTPLLSTSAARPTAPLTFERFPFSLACAVFCARIVVGPSHAVFPTAQPRSSPPRVAPCTPLLSTSAARPTALRPLTSFWHALFLILSTVTCPSTSLNTGFRKHGSHRPGFLPSSRPLLIVGSSSTYSCPSAAISPVSSI